MIDKQYAMSEVRLIDANALIDKMDVMISNAILHDTQIPYALIRELIAEQPTIEPEVRHGRWLSYTGTHYTGKENEYGDPEYKEHIFFVCSNCRRKTIVREHFCPNCGARMDAYEIAERRAAMDDYAEY